MLVRILRSGFEAGNHAGFGAGGKNDVLRFEVSGFVVIRTLHIDGEDAVFAGPVSLP
jgi:hypothetical protein